MKIFNRQLQFAVFALSALLWPAVSSAEIFLQYGNIKGDSTAPGYEEQIDIESFSWGIFKSVDFGSGSGPSIGGPYNTAVSMAKLLDASSAFLSMELLTGKAEVASIKLVRIAGNSYQELIRLELCNVYVTALNTTFSKGQSNPSEGLTLEFAAFKLIQKEYGPGGEIISTETVNWDFATQTQGSCSAP